MLVSSLVRPERQEHQGVQNSDFVVSGATETPKRVSGINKSDRRTVLLRRDLELRWSGRGLIHVFLDLADRTHDPPASRSKSLKKWPRRRSSRRAPNASHSPTVLHSLHGLTPISAIRPFPRRATSHLALHRRRQVAQVRQTARRPRSPYEDPGPPWRGRHEAQSESAADEPAAATAAGEGPAEGRGGHGSHGEEAGAEHEAGKEGQGAECRSTRYSFSSTC